MLESVWLDKAKKLHKTCATKQDEGNGSVKTTDSQSTSLNELQRAIGSGHSTKPVSYNEARASLDTMFDLVKGGKKTPPLTKG
jgi:hypothetical protein